MRKNRFKTIISKNKKYAISKNNMQMLAYFSIICIYAVYSLSSLSIFRHVDKF